LEHIRKQLKQRLLEARSTWSKKNTAKSLHDQMLHRLFAAVKAVWAVEKKTLTDCIMKETRDHIHKAGKEWLRVELLTASAIRKSATEGVDVSDRRRHLTEATARMQECLQELDGISINLLGSSVEENRKRKRMRTS
jgi:hypothetical protein